MVIREGHVIMSIWLYNRYSLDKYEAQKLTNIFHAFKVSDMLKTQYSQSMASKQGAQSQTTSSI